jgi:hypothetical protein
VAFYILIEKIGESDTEATFRFFDTGYPDEVGELRLDKSDARITMTKPTREAFFMRAAQKVSKHHREGHLPQEMCWAS